MSHEEEVELKSPFPVIPPVRDSRWNEPPHSPEEQSRPVEPPKLYPDIGEPHPCPYFIGPDLNFINPLKRKKKQPPIVPTPVIPPPVIIPSPARSPTPENDITFEENEILDLCLQDCLHGVVWAYVADQGRDMTREMFSAMVSKNSGHRTSLDRTTLNTLWRKISKKENASNWTETCDPIDRLMLDVLCTQAYKLTRARFTVTNETISEFHRKTVCQATANSLMELYSSDVNKKLKKQDITDLKQQPPRHVS